MSPKAIDIFTNVIAFLMFLFEPMRSYLMSQPFAWDTFIFTILGAVVAWFTGKAARNRMAPPVLPDKR